LTRRAVVAADTAKRCCRSRPSVRTSGCRAVGARGVGRARTLRRVRGVRRTGNVWTLLVGHRRRSWCVWSAAVSSRAGGIGSCVVRGVVRTGVMRGCIRRRLGRRSGRSIGGGSCGRLTGDALAHGGAARRRVLRVGGSAVPSL